MRRAAVAAGAAVLLLGPAARAASAVTIGHPLSWSPSNSRGAPPGIFDYGTVNAGQAVSQVFTLTNYGTQTSPLTVTLVGSAAFTKTADSCDGTALAPQQSCTVTVTYVGNSSGHADTAGLKAVSSLPRANASVALIGNGSPLSWSPATSPATATYDYGTRPVGQSVSVVFTLTSSGSRATPPLTVTLGGSAAFTKTADSCTGTTLIPGKTAPTCSVTVTYAPTTPGETDQATLTAIGGPGPRASLTLTGAGAKAAPAIATSASAGGPVGTTVTDTAALSGGSAPGGTIEFKLYGPSATAACTGTPVDDETVAISGNGSYTTPAGFAPAQAGTYWWTAAYSGDPGNNPAATACGDEQVTVGSSAHLYWSVPDAGTVTEANLDGSNPQVIFTGVFTSAGVAVNASHLYWALTNGAIYEASLDGSNSQVIVTGQDDPRGMAADGSHLYWADGNPGTIMEANLDGSNPQVIATGQPGPDGVAVDGSHLYWVDTNADTKNGAVMEANLDGSNPQAIVTGQNNPIGVAVNGSQLYWTVQGDSTVMEANLNGTNPHVIATGQGSPIGVAVDSSHLYWVGANPLPAIMEANLDGSNPQAIGPGGSVDWLAVGPQ
jgi:sugar lactone lactonase YvrE